MQSLSEIEAWYETPDPWRYETNPDDIKRKKMILGMLGRRKFVRALDLGAGEGWISKDLPAQYIEGYELSDTAKKRFPPNVHAIDEPFDSYDLVVATGVLYKQYDWRNIVRLIKKHSSGTVLVAGIRDWLVDTSELGELVKTKTFNYREYTQEIRVYQCK